MRILVSIDSMKESLSSEQAGLAIRRGILRADPRASVQVVPIADGGEGTVDALIHNLDGHKEQVVVSDPLGREITAEYGIVNGGKTAVIEMAAAAGLMLLEKSERDPLFTTTYGVGQMITHAIDKGCRHFLIGIGGSATNDGGVGMLQALGFEFLNNEGQPIERGARGLANLCTISVNNVKPEIRKCTFRIACDVKNPLCGDEGCSAVFGPQKGADIASIQKMDEWLQHYAKLTGNMFPGADATIPGTGAAGGLGFAFLSYLGASLEPGIEIIMDEIDFEEYVKNTDIVVTGEGRLDGQSAMGKTPVGIARIAKKYNKPVIALAGIVTPEAKACNRVGIDSYFSILQQIVTLDQALDINVANYNLEATAEQLFRLIKCFWSEGQND